MAQSRGKIVKGVGGLYQVQTENGVYSCAARGLFRNQRISPAVGDDVEIETGSGLTGQIWDILPRRNLLRRPTAANVDQAAVVIAARQPAPNPAMLDRLLLLLEKEKLGIVLCVNKWDLQPAEELARRYELAGYPVCRLSAREDTGLEGLAVLLRGKTTVFAGPSGAGKSSLINRLAPAAAMATGELSAKIGRGKHTTRHAELLALGQGTYLVDTPGFTSLALDSLTLAELPGLFPEFRPFLGLCAFADCAHDRDAGCAVRARVGENIAPERYRSYLEVRQEIREKREQW